MKKLVVLALTLASSLMHLMGQIVPDGGMVTLSNVTNVVNGDVTVGTNAPFTLLVLAGNTLLSNSGNGLIGYNASSVSNEVRLTSATARWDLGQTLFVGVFGNQNRLTISNGAAVTGRGGGVGYLTTAVSNEAVVTGTGSKWANGTDLVIGYGGTGNRLLISAGALATNNAGTLGYASESDANWALVTGSGSTWLNNKLLTVGDSGSGNELVISNGAVVGDGTAYVGRYSSASNNTVTVTGLGSVWEHNSTLYVGWYGQGNLVRIEDGATMASDWAWIGNYGSASNNAVVVSGAGSVWSNRQDLFVGQDGGGNGFTVANGGKAFSQSGTLGYSGGADNNLALIAGAGSTWSNELDVAIGMNGSRNQLVVTNGGQVRSQTGTLGVNAGSGNNFALISGPGSSWSNRADVYVGWGGSGNQLRSEGGARMFAAGNVVIGYGVGANSNALWLADAGTRWERGINTDLVVGSNGGWNSLVLTNGAAAEGRLAVIGYTAGGGSNSMVVTGVGSSLTTSLSTIVGREGSGNRITISDGGVVSGISAYIGLNAASSNNDAILTGPGSRWVATDDCLVGGLGPHNRLVISNAAVLRAGGVTVGQDPTSLNNRLVVDGGTLLSTNLAAGGTLRVVRGTNVLNSGLVHVDILRITNALGRFEFNGGILRVGTTVVNNTAPFIIGSSFADAVMEFAGDGAHSFAGGLFLNPRGTLTGNGTVVGNLSSIGILAPGAGIGKIRVASDCYLVNGSTNVFELHKSAGTNDQVAVAGVVSYGGTLVVTNLGGLLSSGDTFTLFTASNRLGAFTTLVLPGLAPGLSWDNRLGQDGSLRVIGAASREFGVDVSHFQGESGIDPANWSAMFAEGKRFAFIKATESLSVLDATMESNVNRATAAGLRAGVYHFAHPELRPSTNGAIQEADYLLAYAGNFVGPGYLRPVLDLETGSALSTAELTDWVLAFVAEAVKHRGPGAAPIIYCDQFYASSQLDNRMAGYDLWVRSTGSLNPATDNPSPGVFGNWSFWQYSGSGSSGGISPLDLDVCHSEFKPLDSFLIPAATNPVAPIIDIQPQNRSVTVGNSASFSTTVSLSSSTPLTYQWRFNNANLAGATARSFLIPSAQLTNAGAYTVVITNIAGSITSQPATLTVSPPSPSQGIVLYQEDFDSYSPASVVTNPGVTNGYRIFFGPASGSLDFSARFGFDYSGVVGPLSIPSAPHSTNGTRRGLYLTVNKDAVAAVAAVNLYPVSQVFTGSYALKFDMWINHANSGSTTEHVLFGINHSGEITNRVSQGTSDGLLFAVDGDGGVTSGSTILRDFAVFAGGGVNAVPMLLSTNSFFGPEPLLGPQFDNLDPGFSALFPPKDLSVSFTPAGSPGLGWVSVEVRQLTNQVTWLLNDNLVAQWTNTFPYSSGTFLLGYNDTFASVGSPNNFVIFDNVRVETAVPDYDGNGLPDLWEIQYFLSLATDGAADPDGDGMSNVQEYLAGTNPTNSASALRVSGSVTAGNDLVVKWTTVGGYSYVVQWAPAVLAGNSGFVDISPVISAPGGGAGVTNYVHVGGGANPSGYYRVRVVP